MTCSYNFDTKMRFSTYSNGRTWSFLRCSLRHRNRLSNSPSHGTFEILEFVKENYYQRRQRLGSQIINDFQRKFFTNLVCWEIWKQNFWDGLPEEKKKLNGRNYLTKLKNLSCFFSVEFLVPLIYHVEDNPANRSHK